MEVMKVSKKQDPFSAIINNAPQIAGTMLGGAYGGPAGAAGGGALGGIVGKGFSKGGAEAPSVSSPVSRRMDNLQNDPQSILQQGKAELAGMDEQTKASLTPVFDEALKRAATQRQG